LLRGGGTLRRNQSVLLAVFPGLAAQLHQPVGSLFDAVPNRPPPCEIRPANIGLVAVVGAWRTLDAALIARPFSTGAVVPGKKGGNGRNRIGRGQSAHGFELGDVHSLPWLRVPYGDG